MNKVYFLGFLCFLLSLLLVIPSVFAADIAYVLKNTNYPDLSFTDAIDELGYSYDLIDDSKVTSTDFSKYKLILLGNENIDNVPVNTYASLFVNTRYYKTWSYNIASVSNGNIPLSVSLDTGSPIAEGLPSEVQIYTQANLLPVYYLTGKKYDCFRVASVGTTFDDLAKYVIATKENPRRVFFGITETDYWTAGSRKLFKNSIQWVISGSDIDGDGYYADEDCNDNDASIHPGAMEIAYDGIDQNCDGYDLVDVDGDGYEADCSFVDGDCFVEDGDDCNDNDDSIHPGAIEDEKNCENDAPRITSYSPQQNQIRLLKGKSQLFKIEGMDVDSNLDISWYVDDEKVGNGTNYLFETSKDDEDDSYDILAVLTDGEYEVEHLWNILVRGAIAFSCSEAGGYICSEEQICSGSFLGVYNTNRCCPTACLEKPPEFSDIDNRIDKIGKVDLEIENPEENANYYLGDKISGRLKISNNFEESLDFDIEIYLYDITEEEIIDELDGNIEITKNQVKYFDYEIIVPQNIENETHKYVVFARVIDNDEEHYDEDYVKINLKRKDHSVIIEGIEIEPEQVSCSDYVNIAVSVKNIGKNDEDVYIRIRNSNLSIDEKTNEFLLEKYDEKDSAVKEFSIKIPDEADKGKQIIKVELYFNGVTISEEREISLESCEKEIHTKAIETETLALENNQQPILEKVEEEESSSGWLFLLLVIPLGFTIVFGVLFYLFFVR